MGQDLAAPDPEAPDERITARAVMRITGLPRRQVRAAADAGHLTAFVPPEGVRGLVRYSKRSAEALARTMIRPALPTTTAATSSIPPTDGERPHG